jgi:hypothetical protein
MHEVHVEVDVRFHGNGNDSCNCQVTRVRRSLSDTRPAARTPLDYAAHANTVQSGLPYIYGTKGLASSFVEFFLRDSAYRQSFSSSSAYVDLSRVAPHVFAERLQLVLNTWYTLTLPGNTDVVYGSNPVNLSAYGDDFAQLSADGEVAQAVVECSCQLMCTRSTQVMLTQR